MVPSAGGGWRGPTGTGLTVRGAEVSSLQLVDGGVEVRVFNPRDTPSAVSVLGRHGHEMDLAGRVRSTFDGELPLRARGIATLRLADATPEG